MQATKRNLYFKIFHKLSLKLNVSLVVSEQTISSKLHTMISKTNFILI